MSKQESVQIVSKSSSGALNFDEQAFKNVLKPSWDKPLAVISICGGKRKGKSFLVNLLLHHLTEKIEHNISGKIFGKTLEPTFEWRGGPARNTEGIWMTSKPITLPTKQGNVELYVMDTQGMFDNKTNKQEGDQIFTLSTLMSSVLIYNAFHHLQSDDIEQLSFWTKLAQWVGKEQSSSVVQNLLFLIRDFPHEDLGYGVEGGKKYLSGFENEVGESTGSMEVSKNLEELRNLFQNVSAVTLPKPGNAIESRPKSLMSIKTKDIDKKFRQHADELFHLLTSEVHPHKQNDQESMTGRIFYDYAVKCAGSILQKEMPHSKNLSDHVAERWLDNFESEIVNDYRDKMGRILESFTGEFADLQKIHEEQKTHCNDRFDETTKFGKETAIAEARDLMKAKLDRQFTVMSRHVAEASEARQRERKLRDQITKLEKSKQESEERLNSKNLDKVQEEVEEEGSKRPKTDAEAESAENHNILVENVLSKVEKVTNELMEIRDLLSQLFQHNY